MIIDGAERGFPLAWDEIFSDAVPKEVWLSIPHPDGTKEAKRGSIWELDEKQTHNGLVVHLSHKYARTEDGDCYALEKWQMGASGLWRVKADEQGNPLRQVFQLVLLEETT